MAMILISFLRYLVSIFFLTFVPSIAVTVRRFHDIGKNGWTILMAIIPFVGGIILLVFTCLDSEPNDNKYGPNPKSINAENTSKSHSSIGAATFCVHCVQKDHGVNFCQECGKEQKYYFT